MMAYNYSFDDFRSDPPQKNADGSAIPWYLFCHPVEKNENSYVCIANGGKFQTVAANKRHFLHGFKSAS